MKILHISESFEGGVAAAVANYVDLTSEYEHFLLCSKRSGRLDGGILQKFSTIYDLTSGHFSAIKTVRGVVDKVRPDVIHCHSSIGGGYARLAYFWRKCPALMVYSPHCYAFERRDVSWFARSVFYIMEWVMTRGTDVVVACSKREQRLAERMRRKTKAIFVPNLASVRGGDPSLPYSGRENAVVMLGRMSPQKDPEWFAGVAEKLCGKARMIWIGDGEEKFKKVLEEAGVEVTGWVRPREVARMLGEAKVYLHTARWEGFPIALLDATECETAIVVRGEPYLEGVRVQGIVDTVDAATDRIMNLLQERAAWKKNAESWRVAFKDNNSELAKVRLQSAYGTSTAPQI